MAKTKDKYDKPAPDTVTAFVGAHGVRGAGAFALGGKQSIPCNDRKPANNLDSALAPFFK